MKSDVHNEKSPELMFQSMDVPLPDEYDLVGLDEWTWFDTLV